jgi:chromosome segregation ATPase
MEDIQKVKDDIDHFRRRPASRRQETRSGQAAVDRTAKLVAYERCVNSIAERLDKLLNMATDPAIELAAENQHLHTALAESERKNLELQDQIVALQKDQESREMNARRENADVLKTLQDKIVRLESSLAAKQQEIRRERKRANKVETDFERISRANFAAAVAAFPPVDKDRGCVM